MSYLIKNVFDLHVHSSPSLFSRQFNDFYLGRMAIKNDMKGFIIKDHDSITANRAYLVNEYIGRKKAYGSMVFNNSQGGFNSKIFITAINYGIKIAWMPTNQSLYHIKYFGSSDYGTFKREHSLPRWHGLTILNEDNKIKNTVLQVLDIAKENNICLGTGHLSSNEIVKMVDSMSKELTKKTIITHVNWNIFRLNKDIITILKSKGVYFELTLAPIYSKQFKSENIEDLAKLIKFIGTERCIISSDLGQIGSMDPIDAMRLSANALESKGFSEKQLQQLYSENAIKFLGI